MYNAMRCFQRLLPCAAHVLAGTFGYVNISATPPGKPWDPFPRMWLTSAFTSPAQCVDDSAQSARAKEGMDDPAKSCLAKATEAIMGKMVQDFDPSSESAQSAALAKLTIVTEAKQWG